MAKEMNRGEVAYDDDNSIQFPSAEPPVTETVCASNSTVAPKEATAKQDHWVVGKKNNQPIRVQKLE